MFKKSISLSRNNINNLKKNINFQLTEDSRKNSISNLKLNNYIDNKNLFNETVKKDKNSLPQLKNNPILTTPNIHRISRKKILATTISPINKKDNLFLKLKIDDSNNKNLNYINFRQSLRRKTTKKHKNIMNNININETNNYNILESIKDLNNYNSNRKENNKNIAEYDFSLMIKKLDNWDKDHCIKSKKDLYTLHKALNNYYKKNNLIEEQNDLNNMDNMLQEKLNYYRYKENKTYGIRGNKSKNLNTEENEINDKDVLNSLIINNLNKSYTKNKIDLFNKMHKERLNYENQLQKELIFVNNIIFNKKYIKKEKNIELNKLYSEIDRVKNDYDFKKSNFLKEISNLFEEFSIEHNTIMSEKLNEVKQINENKNEQVLKKLEKKRTKKDISNQIKDLEFIKKNRMYTINNEMKIGLEKINNEFKIKFNELDIKKQKLDKELNIINTELNYYKNINEELLREHQIYFLDILKKGKDCRKEGLVWVVKNLLELQINLEYHHFPKYLTHEQINYLKKLAYLSLEENELKIILKILKRKQKDNRETATIQYMNFFDTISSKEINKNKQNEKYQTKSIKKQTVNYDEDTLLVKNKIDTKFLKIYRNNEEAFKIYLAKSLEDEKMQNIIYYIKKALYNNNDGFLKDNKISIIEAFMGKTKNKDFFGLILNITNRLHEIEKTKKSMINKEKEYYLERIKNNNGNNNMETLDYLYNKELIKNGLFGNKIDF